MAGTEAARHRVFEAFHASHGEEVASDLMELLPPAGMPELATRQDLQVLEAGLKAELAEMKGEFRGELGEVRGELGKVRGELAELIAQQTNHYVRWMFVAVGTATALSTAASTVVTRLA